MLGLRARWVACTVALAACGGGQRRESSADEGRVPEREVVAEPMVEDLQGEVASGDEPRPCAELDAARCDPMRCVSGREGCREPANACELVTPEPTWDGRPVFSGGDPCERVRPECAYDVSTGRCTTFAAVRECPASLDAARAAVVHCNHSSQEPLQCAYPSADCGCAIPARCSGLAPMPHEDPPPSAFRCIPHVDANGCPNRIREGTRCRPDGLHCPGCAVSHECVRGRWRAIRHGPPP